MKHFFTIIYQEIHITLRQGFSWVTPLFFFILVVTFFPLAIGPDEILLKKLAPGIIWIAALLAILLSIGNLFQNDADEGYLDCLLKSPHPLTLLVICKIISHWLTYCLPLMLISPLLGFLLHLTVSEDYALIVSLLLGTPVLILLGSIGAALTIGIRNHGLLLPILIMPLYVPVLIFGTSALTTNQAIGGYFAIMGALLLVSAAFSPLLTSIALRIGMSQ